MENLNLAKLSYIKNKSFEILISDFKPITKGYKIKKINIEF